MESSSVDLVTNAWSQTEAASKVSAAQHILVIAGTVTHALVPTVKSAYEALQEPKVVVAFGACAISGGPYWDSYSVVSGAHEVIPVDIQVPGCPPGPEELAAALMQAVELASK
jgi:NADH-quinone oxidoreductase subunit B